MVRNSLKKGIPVHKLAAVPEGGPGRQPEYELENSGIQPGGKPRKDSLQDGQVCPPDGLDIWSAGAPPRRGLLWPIRRPAWLQEGRQIRYEGSGFPGQLLPRLIEGQADFGVQPDASHIGMAFKYSRKEDPVESFDFRHGPGLLAINGQSTSLRWGQVPTGQRAF